MTQLYFGAPWPSDICEDGVSMSTPVGVPCLFCDEPILDGDRGWFMMVLAERMDKAGAQRKPVHRECSLRNVTGGIEHLTAGPHAVGSCYAGSTLTYRQSSLLAWDWVMKHGTGLVGLEGEV